MYTLRRRDGLLAWSVPRCGKGGRGGKGPIVQGSGKHAWSPPVQCEITELLGLYANLALLMVVILTGQSAVLWLWLLGI